VLALRSFGLIRSQLSAHLRAQLQERRLAQRWEPPQAGADGGAADGPGAAAAPAVGCALPLRAALEAASDPYLDMFIEIFPSRAAFVEAGGLPRCWSVARGGPGVDEDGDALVLAEGAADDG
jgi:hypothetical protein